MRLVGILLTLVCLSCTTTFRANLPSYNLESSRASYMEDISQRTVHIKVVCKSLLPAVLQPLVSTGGTKYGTGVVLKSTSKKSFIMTARHVIDGDLFTSCNEVSVFHSKDILSISPIKATVVAKSDSDDIAVVSVEENLKLNTPLVKDVYVGQKVVSAGFPAITRRYVESISITEGVIATKIFDPKLELNLIRITAPAYFGNSGGGVFTADGHLVGITSFIMGTEVADSLNNKTYAPRPGYHFIVAFSKIKAFLIEANLSEVII